MLAGSLSRSASSRLSDPGRDCRGRFRAMDLHADQPPFGRRTGSIVCSSILYVAEARGSTGRPQASSVEPPGSCKDLFVVIQPAVDLEPCGWRPCPRPGFAA